MKYVTYLRVSTQKQGRSMLGLEAQRKMCASFIEQHHGELAKEFIDVESGTHRDRKGLWGAIDYCKSNNMPLVIAKLDRLARDVEFTFKVINTGIQIHFTDMPLVNTMILGVFAAVAQYERELTSKRTKDALAAKKAKGEKIGAASDKYHITKEKKAESASKAGATRTRRVLEKRDTQVLIQIMKKVFPKCRTTEESKWCSTFVSVNLKSRKQFFDAMVEYQSIDNDLFRTWDLSDFDNPKLIAKLTSKLQSIVKMLTR